MSTIDFGVSWCIFKVAGCKEGQESDLSIWLMQKSKILMVFNDSCDTFIRCFKNICGVFNYLLVYLSPTFFGHGKT